MAKSGVVRLEKKLHKNPGGRGFAWVGSQFVEHGNIPRGLEFLRANRAAAPGDLEGLLALGRVEQLDGNYELARECYEEAVKIDPSSPGAWSGLYETEKTLGDEDGARKAANAWRLLDPFAFGDAEEESQDYGEYDEASLDEALAGGGSAEGQGEADLAAAFGSSELEVPFDQVASLLDQVPGGEESQEMSLAGLPDDSDEIAFAPPSDGEAAAPEAQAPAPEPAPEAAAQPAPEEDQAKPAGGAAFVTGGDDEDLYQSPVTGSDVSSAIDDLFGDVNDEELLNDITGSVSPEAAMPQDNEVNQQLNELFIEEEDAETAAENAQVSQDLDDLAAMFDGEGGAKKAPEAAPAAEAEKAEPSADDPSVQELGSTASVDDLLADFGGAAAEPKPEEKKEEPAPEAENAAGAEADADDLLADLDTAFGAKADEPAAEAKPGPAAEESAPEAEAPSASMDDLLADLDGPIGASDGQAPAEEKTEPEAEAPSASMDDLLSDLDTALGASDDMASAEAKPEPAPEAETPSASMDDLLADLDGALGASDDLAPAEAKPEAAAEGTAEASPEAEGSLPATEDLLTDLDAAFVGIENKSAGPEDPELKAEKSSEPTTDELISDLDGILTAPQSPVSLDAPENSDDALAGLDSIFEVEESEPIPGLSGEAAPAAAESPAPAAEEKSEPAAASEAKAAAPKRAESSDGGLGDAVADELGSLLGDDDEESDFKLESAAEAANEAGDGFLPETATMAEIYAGQGHYEQAIKIYRDKLERDPSDEHASRRIAELEALLNRNNPQE